MLWSVTVTLVCSLSMVIVNPPLSWLNFSIYVFIQSLIPVIIKNKETLYFKIFSSKYIPNVIRFGKKKSYQPDASTSILKHTGLRKAFPFQRTILTVKASIFVSMFTNYLPCHHGVNIQLLILQKGGSYILLKYQFLFQKFPRSLSASKYSQQDKWRRGSKEIRGNSIILQLYHQPTMDMELILSGSLNHSTSTCPQIAIQGF